MFPRIASAADIEQGVAGFVDRLFDILIQPFLLFLFALATVMFLYGMVRFIATSDKSSDDARKGRQHMLWGIIGMFVMMSVFGIMRLIINTLGIDV